MNDTNRVEANLIGEVWFWQRIVSPHMVGLACALARKGCRVKYVVEESLSADRIALGWQLPTSKDIEIVFAKNEIEVQALLSDAKLQSVHICQGLRGNGYVSVAQKVLMQRHLQQWLIMETVDDVGIRGVLKRLEYKRLFFARRQRIQGVLAIGHRTTNWVAARGMPAKKVFPFAYFLPESSNSAHLVQEEVQRPFRFIFVGQFVERKRLDLLIRALSLLEVGKFELWVVGSGKLEETLRARAFATLPGCVHWKGKSTLAEARIFISKADCLVLPSRHDGWGAVVSEALIAGTPAICSDACGAAGVVRASGVGGVFPADDEKALSVLLQLAIRRGTIVSSQRLATATWARALGDEMGATYLLHILQGKHPLPPWDVDSSSALDDSQ